jgi:RNase P subunit RPR2
MPGICRAGHLIKAKEKTMAYCKKCKSPLIACSECNGSGKQGPGEGRLYMCLKCKGTGQICQMHGADHGNPKK